MERLKGTRSIPIKLLKVKGGYQRILHENKLKQYEKAYDDNITNVIRVAERDDGTFAIIDGQHTVELLRRVKGEDAEVDCIVYTGTTVQEEAKLFEAINSSRTKTQNTVNEGLKALLIARDPQALSYETALKRHHIPFSFKTSKKGYLCAHSKPFAFFKKYGEHPIMTALEILDKGFSAHPDRFSNRLISGMVSFLTIYDDDEINIDEFLKKLAKYAPSEIVSKRRLYGATSDGGGTNTALDKIGARVFADIYNEKKKKYKLDVSKIVEVK